jgi:hypothetical protein
MARERRHQENLEQGQGRARNPKSADAQKEMTDARGRQNKDKVPRRQTAAISEEGDDNHGRHRKVELRTAITSGKRRNAQEGHT